MKRILGIELRRSAARGAALVVFVMGVVALFFSGGTEFAQGWMPLAMSQRLGLAVLFPLALASGAWQSARERRSKVGELFASTPRPRGERMTPTLGAMGVAVVAGYLVSGLAGVAWIAGTARYLPVAAFVVTLVGCLSLVAAVWLGQAIGRLLPWLVTAPLLAIAGLAALLLIPAATRPRGWLALVFSPLYEMNMPGPYTTVPASVSVSQTLWLVALAVAAVLLLASGGWRLRVAALLPVVVGAALAITVMPKDSRYVTDSIDSAAQSLVCAKDEPQVCISRVHSGLLSEVTPGAREGLAILAKLPGGPTQVHEDTTSYPDYYPAWHDDVVLLPIGVRGNGHLDGRSQVMLNVVVRAFDSRPECDKSADWAQMLAAGYWLMGRAVSSDDGFHDPDQTAEGVQLWQKLRQLPAGEAQAQVVALRKAALSCTVDEKMLR